MNFDLTGRAAIVTGSAQGLGRAIAYALAAAGSDVLGADIQPDQSETRSAIESTGRRFVAMEADVAIAADTIVANALGAFGRIDILVNNAGILRHRPMLEVPAEEWERVMEVNLTAAFRLTQATARTMVRAGRGSIINITSLLAFQGSTKVPSYVASKAGLAGLTRAMANELGPHGVRVNAIAPGYMNTANTAALRSSAKANSVVSMLPLARWGEPADLAGPVVFLASDASAYVTGHMLVVDGGWLSGNF